MAALGEDLRLELEVTRDDVLSEVVCVMSMRRRSVIVNVQYGSSAYQRNIPKLANHLPSMMSSSYFLQTLRTANFLSTE